MFLKDIGSHQIPTFRIAEIAGAVVLGFLAIIVVISEIEALFTGSEILFGLGILFVDSLGILAFVIPLYFFYAAFLLAHPAYRPDRIFILNCSLFPFLTLIIGFVFIRDFDSWSEQLPFLSWIGKGGFNFFIILLTVLEGIIIGAFTSLLFPGAYKKEESQDNEYATGLFYEQSGSSQWQEAARMSKSPWDFLNRRSKSASKLLPPPILKHPFSGTSPAPVEEGYVTYDDRILKECNEEEIDIENLRLPDIKPLASLTALGTLESISPKPGRSRGYQGMDTEDASIEPIEPYLDADPSFQRVGSPSNRENQGFHSTEDKTTRYELVPESKPPRSSWMSYQIPVEGLLNQYPEDHQWTIDQTTKDATLILKETLAEFNIQAELRGIKKGPVLTLFEILPAAGVKSSKIVNLQDNIALRLGAASVRILAPMPGKSVVAIEVPNTKRQLVSFAGIIEEELYHRVAPGAKKLELPVVLGRDITGEPHIMDLVQMSHLLIAGAGGSGKSVWVNALILSILYQRSPVECRLILIDPQIRALTRYNDMPHLLTPVITEPRGAFQALQYCIFEMERRYGCLDSLGVRDIRMYNKRIRERGMGVEHLPYIVVVIDEFADLMAIAGKELESSLAHLAAMSRAVGIHLILTTQRPSLDVITGRIKANIPSRIAFMVDSKMDSRIIMDIVGAEKLLGRGDLLYAGTEDSVPIRMQGAFVSEEEVERVVEYLKTLGDPDYIDDELFNDDAGVFS